MAGGKDVRMEKTKWCFEFCQSVFMSYNNFIENKTGRTHITNFNCLECL